MTKAEIEKRITVTENVRASWEKERSTREHGFEDNFCKRAIIVCDSELTLLRQQLAELTEVNNQNKQ